MSTEEGKNFSFDAVIFDLDGVITKTATVHASSWKAMFDEYLKIREKRNNEPFKEFSYEKDYLVYVDGKPRYKGVESFLESRGIKIPLGKSQDSPEEETVCGLGNRKNIKFREILSIKGVAVYPAAIELIHNLREKKIHIGVASSSKNCQFVLQAAKIEEYFETRVDGMVSTELGLEGKPQGDIFVKAAENVGSSPEKAIVFEDAVAGVQAGVNGGFSLVVGIARENNEEELKANGADVVISSFESVTPEVLNQWFDAKLYG